MLVPLLCSTCGPVHVDPSVVEVHINRRDDFVLYAFTCPTCLDLVVGGSRDRIRELLDAGARRRDLRSAADPPLTYDDLLDFHLWLERDLPWPSDPTQVA